MKKRAQIRSQSALLPMREAQGYLGNRSRQWFYDQIRKDSSFPRPVKTGPHTIAFIRAEMDEYISRLPRAEFDGFSAVQRRQAAREDKSL